MTAAERAIAGTAASLCQAALAFAIASLALTLVALLSLALGAPPPRSAWAWWIVALAGPIATWFAFRIAFDARVFGDLARVPDAEQRAAADLDGALAAILSRAPVPGRPLDERARGARRLIARLVSVTAFQFAAALFAALPA